MTLKPMQPLRNGTGKRVHRPILDTHWPELLGMDELRNAKQRKYL
jgi:hypothetical protein